jgi:hypothetical protein
MRKVLLAALLLVAVAALMLVSGFGRVAAAKADNGAVIINDAGCGLLDGNGGFALADSDHAVITSNGNGVLVCKASGLANDTGTAVRYNFASTGFLCGTPAGATQDWSETVSASGNATLSCHVNVQGP